jgi:hypothetical protein
MSYTREDKFLALMTPEIASFIKNCRVSQERTWRSVGWLAHVQFPQLGIQPIEQGWVNQLDGRALCNAAMEFLGEDVSEGWN